MLHFYTQNLTTELRYTSLGLLLLLYMQHWIFDMQHKQQGSLLSFTY